MWTKKDETRTGDVGLGTRKNKKQKVGTNPGEHVQTKGKRVETKPVVTRDMGNILKHTNKYTDKIYTQKETKDFVLFWQQGSPFSQWHQSMFTVDELTFNCAEQYMMYNKALLCDNEELSRQVMTEIDPKAQKDIGKQAALLPSFRRKEWDTQCKTVVRHGSIAKFSQNPRLKALLLQTYPKILAEASPFDTKWGIGIAADHSDSCIMEKWKGRNLLGEVLMEVRDELLKDENLSSKD